MNPKTLIVVFGLVTSLLVFTPNAAADDESVCDPTNLVCVVQDDGSPGDPECDDGYLSSYGANQKSNGVYVNGGDANAYVRLDESCGHWFFHDAHSWGLSGGANAGGASANVYWRGYDVDANPFCGWGAENRDGTVIGGNVNDGTDKYGVEWRDETTTACGGGAGSTECTTKVFTGALGEDQDLGCPVGAPPGPPSPDEFPYGALIPDN